MKKGSQFNLECKNKQNNNKLKIKEEFMKKSKKIKFNISIIIIKKINITMNRMMETIKLKILIKVQ